MKVFHLEFIIASFKGSCVLYIFLSRLFILDHLGTIQPVDDVTPTKTTLNHIFGRIYISQEGDYPPTNLQDILAIFMDIFYVSLIFRDSCYPAAPFHRKTPIQLATVLICL